MKLSKKLRQILITNAILYFVTFYLVLPHFAQYWIYSPLFKTPPQLLNETTNSLVNRLSTERFREAQSYLRSLTLINKSNTTYNNPTDLNVELSIVAVVITTKRTLCLENEFDCEPHYLQQTVAALDQDVKRFYSYNQRARVQILICNVDPNWKQQQDFQEINQKFPVVYKYSQITENHTFVERNTKYVESLDYAFCLNAGGKYLNVKTHNSTTNTSDAYNASSTNYVLMIEDDAVVFKNFFKNAVYILKNRVEMKHERDSFVKGKPWMDIKFFLPETWAGFEMAWSTIFVLSIFGLFGATLFYSVYICRLRNLRSHSVATILLVCFFGGLHMILVALVVNKQALMEILRVSPFTLAVFSDRGCCTPAVIYPTNKIPSIVEYLTSENCERCIKGVDLALSDFAEINNLESYRVQPNLIKHIGMYSSVKFNTKNPLTMLFYDFMYDKI